MSEKKNKRKTAKTRVKNKAILIFIVVLVIALCILTTSISLIKRINDNSENNDAENTFTGSIENVYDEDFSNTINNVNEQFISEEKIVPENYNFLVRLYEGPVESETLYGKIYDLVYEIIPSTIDTLDGKTYDEIKTYYETNAEVILEETGIDNVADYQEFVNIISNIGDSKYESSSFDIANYTNDTDYFEVDLIINYEDDKILTVEVQLANTSTSSGEDVIFSVKE